MFNSIFVISVLSLYIMYCMDFIRIDNIIVLYIFLCFIPSCRGTNQLITRDDTDFFSFEFSFLTRSAQRTQKFALLRSQIVPR